MKLTKPREMVKRAIDSINENGPDAQVGIILRGKFQGTMHERNLFHKGPRGHVMAGVKPNHIIVMFKAAEVIEAVRPHMLCPWCHAHDEAPCFYCESVGYLEKF